MQFIKDNDLYKVARITGPTHNFLAIRLAEENCSTEIKALPIKQGDVERIDSQSVLVQVLRGLDAINLELGAEYQVSEVQFIPSDSDSSSVYELLIRELIKRIDSNGEFVVI